VAGCALRQGEILDDAAPLVRPGGRLVYATCTFAPEEDEGAIFAFLRRHPEYSLVQPMWAEGFAHAEAAWAGWPLRDDAVILDHAEALHLERAVRLWPHHLQGEGHFVAVMQRAGEAATAPWMPARATRLGAADRAAIEAFWQPMIARPLPERLLLRPLDEQITEVTALPADAPDTAGLRMARAGWRLGTLQKGRFEPSHALAMGLPPGEALHRLDEPMGSELVGRFMRGETLDAPGADGWILITVGGFAVGWGKRSRDVIKNHYPKSLRWR